MIVHRPSWRCDEVQSIGSCSASDILTYTCCHPSSAGDTRRLLQNLPKLDHPLQLSRRHRFRSWYEADSRLVASAGPDLKGQPVESKTPATGQPQTPRATSRAGSPSSPAPRPRSATRPPASSPPTATGCRRLRVGRRRLLRGPLPWNATLLEGDLAASVRALKDRHDGTLIVSGAGELARELTTQGLVDEFWFWVSPYLLQTGLRIFDGVGPVRLELIGSTTFLSGVLGLAYRPVPNQDSSYALNRGPWLGVVAPLSHLAADSGIRLALVR